jgi:hypothetical protein
VRPKCVKEFFSLFFVGPFPRYNFKKGYDSQRDSGRDGFGTPSAAILARQESLLAALNFAPAHG